MKILLISDLHIDDSDQSQHLNRIADAIRLVGQEADALIIAGDLTDLASEKWPGALKWLGHLYPSGQTILFPGNHDYYGENIDTLDQGLETICSSAGCSYGQCRTIVIGDTRILMTTLWTDMRLFEANGPDAVSHSVWAARQMMPDYGYGVIMTGDPEREITIRPRDTIALHERQKTWLISKLARPWIGKTIVVTHHAPSAAVSGPITMLSPCFVSNLDDLIDMYRPHAWFFGHTHWPACLRMPGGTILRNVSVGYDNEYDVSALEEHIRCGLIDLDGPILRVPGV